MPDIVFATINVQGVTDPAVVALGNAISPLPGVHIAMVQEAAPLRGRWSLRRRLSRRTVGVHQVTRRPDQAGSALVWDRTRARAVRRGLVPLAEPEPGDRMRPRWGAWADLLIDNRIMITAISAHRPLRATGDQVEFDRALARFILAARHPVIVGLDANAPTLHYLTRMTQARWFPVGIDGFIISRGLCSQVKVTMPWRLLPTRSDHTPIAIALRLPDHGHSSP